MARLGERHRATLNATSRDVRPALGQFRGPSFYLLFVYLRTASQSRVALNAVLANCRDTNHVQLPLANAFGTVPAHGYLSSAPFLTPVDGQAQSTGAPVTGETVCVLPARGLAQRCTATSNSSGLGAGPDEHGRGGPRPRATCATPLARVAPRAAHIAA